MAEHNFDRLLSQELAALRNRISAEHGQEVERLRKKVKILSAELEQRHAPLAGEPERKNNHCEDGVIESYRVNVRMARTAEHFLEPEGTAGKEADVADRESGETQEKKPQTVAASQKAMHSGSDFGTDLRSTAKSNPAVDLRDASGLVGQHQAWRSTVNSNCRSAWDESEDLHGDPLRSSKDQDFIVYDEWKFRASIDKLTRRRSLMTNQSAMQMTGTAARHTESERERQLRSAWLRPFMLQPSSTKHLTWEIIVLIFICYDVVVIPLELLEPEVLEEEMFMRVMGYFQRAFWTLDIFKSFLTGILMQNGTVDMRPQRVAGRYATTWLPLDVVCVTIDWLTLADIGHFRPISGLLRFLRIFRILKLIRLFKAPEFTKFVSENIRSDAVILLARILQNIVLLLGTSHLIACVWYWVGTLGATGTTWVEFNKVKDLELRYRWIWSMHWALAQFTGEMVFSPQNITERSFAVVNTFFTFLCSVMFVGSITTCMTQLMILSGKKENQLTTLRRFLYDHKISNQLSVRMMRNAQHGLREHSKNVTEKSVEVLSMISEPLMMELHFELHSPVLMVHRFFSCYHEVNLSGIMSVCHNSVSSVHYTRDDRVFTEFEAPGKPRMYFCTHGKLHYEHEAASRDMVKDQWACEAVLWTKWIHCGNLQAVNESTFHCVDSEKFRHVLSPTPFMHTRSYAVAFVEHLNSTDRAQLSDFHHEHLDSCVQQVFPWAERDQNQARSALGWFRPSLQRSGTFFDARPMFFRKSSTRASTKSNKAVNMQPTWSLESRPSVATINSDTSNEVIEWCYDDVEWAYEEEC